MEGTELRLSVPDVILTPVIPKLVKADRCDRCSAQARVRTANGDGKILDFCMHHHDALEPALTGQGFAVVEKGLWV